MVEAVSGEQGEGNQVGRWPKSRDGLGADGCSRTRLELNGRAGPSRTRPVITPALSVLVRARGGGLLPLLCLSKTHSHHRPFQTPGFSSRGETSALHPVAGDGAV